MADVWANSMACHHIATYHNCRLLPLGEFTVTIPEPHATLQSPSEINVMIVPHLQGVRILSAILKIVFHHILLFFCFYAFIKIKLASCYLLLYVVYTCQKSFNFISTFACYKQTRGQSNLTKSASRGPIPLLGVTAGGRKLYHWIPG